MTKEQLEKLRRPVPTFLQSIYVEHVEEDEHGYYSTGLFHYKGKDIFVNVEEGRWHLSASCNHVVSYYELKEIRCSFLPNRISAVQILPSREDFLNLHENCYHLFEIG